MRRAVCATVSMPTSSQPSLMAIMFVDVTSPSRMVMGPWNSGEKFRGRQSLPLTWGYMTGASTTTCVGGMLLAIADV